MTARKPLSANDLAQSLSPLQGDQTPLGHTLRARRVELGLTLQAVATQAGCARSYLSMIESGRRAAPPGVRLLGQLETVLGLDPGTLLALADWHNTPAPIRQRLESLIARDQSTPAPPTNLDDLWRSGRLHALVEELGTPGVPSDAGNIRSITPGAPSPTVEVPLINSVAAGPPRGFTDKGYPPRAADSYIGSRDTADPDAFACRVVGDSMMPEYREGDVVIFSPARAARDGTDCFVRLEPDHESTFKRVFFERRAGGESGEHAQDGAPVTHVRLQPLNPRHPARTLPREQVAGLYPAISVTRRLI